MAAETGDYGRNPLNLSGKLVLVTGASSGLGRAIAIFLSRLGAQVILNGRRPDCLEETRSMMEFQDMHSIETFDLSDIDGIPGWMKKICGAKGTTLDGLVHSAGVAAFAPLRTVSRRHIDEVMVPNLYAALGLMRGMSSKLVASNAASVVLLSSVAAVYGSPGRAAYSASKGALNAFILTATRELAERKVRVNCVSPAYVSGTRMAQEALGMGESMDELISRHFLGLPSVEDVAAAVAFLLCERARTITGQNLVIDGGLSC